LHATRAVASVSDVYTYIIYAIRNVLVQACDFDDGGVGLAGVDLVEVEMEVDQLLIHGGGQGAAAGQ
jgi:hypothetical protein